jgi:hypothetical protein
MAVVVVRARRDQGETRAQAPQQRRVLPGRAVVGDLEHVDRRQPGVLGQQPPLRLRLQVAGEQDGQAAGTQQQRHAGVVRLVPQARRVGGRPQHLPAQALADAAPLARHGRDHPHPRLGGDAVDERRLLR